VDRIAEDVQADAVAINSKTNKIYLAEDFSNTIYIVDGNTDNITSNITLKKSAPQIRITQHTIFQNEDPSLLPSSLALNPNTSKIYVANRFSNILSVIDGSTEKLVDNLIVMQKPDAVAVNSHTNMVYVSNEDANRVSVINGTTDTLLKTIIIPSNNSTSANNYSELDVDPTTNVIVMTDKYSSTLSIINGTTNNLLNTIKVGNSPSDVAVNPTTNMVYVTNMRSNTVSVIDGKAGHVLIGSVDDQSSLPTLSGFRTDTGPLRLAINPNTNKIYAIYEFSNKVSVIDGTTDSLIDTITLDNVSNAIAVNPITNMIYVANRDADTVSVVNGRTDKVVPKFHDENSPISIAVNPITNMIYVADLVADTISVIDGLTNKMITYPSNSTDTGIQDVAVDPKTNMVYMARDDVFTVSVTEGIRKFDRLHSSNIYKIISNVTVGEGPYEVYPRNFYFSLAINPNTDIVYASNWLYNMIGVIDGETNTLIANISNVNTPEKIAVNPNTDTLYAASPVTNIVYVIDGHTNQIVSKINVGQFPTDIAVNPSTNLIYVTNRDSDSISVIDGYTNRMVTNIAFRTNPANSGIIYCNGQKIPANYHNFEAGTTIECEAKANPGYAFSSWSGDVSSNQFNPLKFTASEFGKNVYANFIIPTEVALPNELFNKLNVLIISVIIPSLVGWSIPFIIGWFRSERQKKQLRECLSRIDTTFDMYKDHTENLIQNLDKVKWEIQNIYASGKISDSHYALLTSKISEYRDRIKKS
jgi:YVTN family beta-propeller protein